MAVTQDKVKARLRALFPKANLSKARLDAIAAKLAEKPADDATDEQVDEVINDYNEVFNFDQIAKDDDRIRTLESRAANPPKTEEEEPKVDDETPAWAKALLSKVEQLESQQRVKSITERFNSDPRVKDIPDFIRKGYIPSGEDDFEEKVSELADSFKEYADKHKIAAYPNDVPGAGTPPRNPGAKIKPKTLAEVKDLAITI